MELRIRLLWYNTFLLPGVEISPLLVGLVLERLANKTALGRRLAGEVERLLTPLHNFARRPFLTLGQKPNLEPRVREIGQVLIDLMKREDADATIMALGEVFAPATRLVLFGAIRELGAQAVYGPPEGIDGVHGEVADWLPPMTRHGGLPLSGGLFTLAGGLPIRQSESEAFRFLSRGHPIRDPDFWSNKGVLLTELELDEETSLELYTTHLFSGHVIGEAIWMGLQRLGYRYPGLFSLLEKALLFEKAFGQSVERYRHFFDLPEERLLEIQRAQLRQLIDFIIDHHGPRNIVVLAGDFNLDAHEPSHREFLSSELSRLTEAGIELEEVFTARGTTPKGTILHLDHLHGPQTIGDDPAGLITEHIDYVFIQRPGPEHRVELVVEECRRRTFPRDPVNPGMNYLSDHMGLEVMLRASPKPR
ncbi:MAG: endonuclease/exonuclease/phosphatase family protein [Bradymonadaceae bacterium]